MLTSGEKADVERWLRKNECSTLTRSERATYQSLVDRGFSHEDALEDALDGVDVDYLRRHRVRHTSPGKELS
jgi:hypothetical protein